MKPRVLSTYSRSVIADAVADLFTFVILRSVESPSILRPTGVGKDVVVTLGGFEDNRRWDVEPTGLGFHAISTNLKFDHDDDGEEIGDGWYDVNEHHEVVVNVEMAVTLCVEHAMMAGPKLDEQDFMTSLIVTPIHELMHLADWMDFADGRTPL